ncbi:MAG: valine--tRNA ligase [Tissierellia bacterium]|nr:valine--tRNA ligase [Tissierellia bacterium]
MKNLDKNYDPSLFEDRIYKEWEEGGYFTAKVNKDKKPFSMVMPPPNVTGQLHIGHAINNTLQDIIIRWKRMSGYEALWVPGTDHASISTEAKVVDKLKKEGKTKEELGREGFLEEAWEWTRLYGGTIKKQLRKLGVSCDWTKDSFTLDDNLSDAVLEVFINMYKEGLIYKGERILNYCPSCKTTISDAEVEHIDEHGHLWHIKYPIKDSDDFITIATTRPETMLGDLAVAIHPDDERFKHLLGKTLVLPLVGREIPIIADSYVDMEYGSGFVKITPSHDPNDFEIGKRHNLGQCIVIENDATISEGYGKYTGMDRYEARKEIVKDLEDLGLLAKVEDLDHAVGHCERCKTVIEPLVSEQWFVAMQELAKPALEAYRNGDLKIIPDRFGKIYVNWLENIRDWNISRQLWWGHRLPVYNCKTCGYRAVEKEMPDTCPVCGSDRFEQEEGTLDTWFSSALWPFSTLGWPKKTEEFEYFFPTDALITGYDIIFFWVVRMVFSSLHNTGKLPFKTVYLNGIVRDEQGRKMSKSLGNGVDPLEEIQKYGADALRFSLVTGNSPGNDMRYTTKKVEANRNFANKLWNASRFIFMNMEDDKEYKLDFDKLEIEDKWIISRINSVAKDVNRLLDSYEIGVAASQIYEFIWFEFCDWYIEFVKNRLYGKDAEKKDIAMASLLYSLDNILRLLHPFMPFITEEIYGLLPDTNDMIIVSNYPQFDEDKNFQWEEKSVATIIDAITAIRNQRAELKVPNSKKSKLYVFSEDRQILDLFEKLSYNLESLASISELESMDHDKTIEETAPIIMKGYKLYLSLQGLIDYEKELNRLKEEEKKVLSEIKRAQGKLSNEKFVSKAPEKLVEEEKAKLEKYTAMSREIEQSIVEIENKLGI